MMTNEERQALEDEEQAAYLEEWARRNSGRGGRCALIALLFVAMLAWGAGAVVAHEVSALISPIPQPTMPPLHVEHWLPFVGR